MSGYLSLADIVARDLYAQDIKEQVERERAARGIPEYVNIKELTDMRWSELGREQKEEYLKKARLKLREKASSSGAAGVDAKSLDKPGGDEDLKQSDEPANDDD